MFGGSIVGVVKLKIRSHRKATIKLDAKDRFFALTEALGRSHLNLLIAAPLSIRFISFVCSNSAQALFLSVTGEEKEKGKRILLTGESRKGRKEEGEKIFDSFLCLR